MRIYFTRHGESEANILREFSSRGIKHGLTEKGRGQMDDLAGKLASVCVTRILTSPLLRAKESSEILGKVLEVPISVAEALREIDVGDFEGRRDKEAWERYWQLRKDWSAGKLDSRIEGGESLKDLERRFVPFLRTLEAGVMPDEEIVLVGHSGLYCAVLPMILRNVDSIFAESHGIEKASYVLAEEAGDSLTCKQWGEISFP